ncbi:hypothetical protein [Treponema putidum]|uniref:hypothetical protein n=1 Tax=Treponema putidum TaxID=221027 RepID=UPI002102084C|nr:hypothetical protein [Treponema putidum]UTY30687.1 hypothetical protein E4N75_03315 [Treponema putidum]
MAKERARKQSISGIRLLIAFFLLFFCFSFAHAGIEEDAQLSFSSSPLFIDSVFEIKIKLDDSSFHYHSSAGYAGYAGYADIPKLIIVDDEEVLEFLDSAVNSLYGGILITNKYKLKKIGTFGLVPYLSLGNSRTKLKNFSIQVEPPALSKDTIFKWKILDAVSYSPVEKIVQGKKYLIVLAGFFYDYFSRDGKPSGLDINCQAPENSILEDTDNIKNNIDIKELGWKAVSCFFWTPLKTGEISLPIPQISITSESKSSRKIYIREQKVNVIEGRLEQEKISDDEKKAYESLKSALEVKDSSAAQNVSDNHKKNFDEKISKALIIAQLRVKEANSLFSGQEKAKRLEYEKDLNLKESFTVRSAIFKKILWPLLFILLAAEVYFIICFKKKKNRLKTLLIVCFIFVSALLFFYLGQYERAVYRPTGYDEESVVYHIPEKNGAIVSSLQIGETVIIKQKTSEWFFVEKRDGTGGWQKKSEFIITD